MRKKLILVLSLTVVLVGVFAAVALAEGQLIQCKKSVPCYGGKGEDKILERIGNRKDDQIVPKGGDDLVLANKYTNDTDVVRGGARLVHSRRKEGSGHELLQGDGALGSGRLASHSSRAKPKGRGEKAPALLRVPEVPRTP